MQFSFSQEKFFFQILWLQNVIHSYLFLEILLSRQSYFHDFLEEGGLYKSMVSALYLGVRGGDDMEVIWCKQYTFLFSMATSTRLSFIFKDICLFVFSRYHFFGGWFIFYTILSVTSNHVVRSPLMIFKDFLTLRGNQNGILHKRKIDHSSIKLT